MKSIQSEPVPEMQAPRQRMESGGSVQKLIQLANLSQRYENAESEREEDYSTRPYSERHGERQQ
jgi:hypothetical protein